MKRAQVASYWTGAGTREDPRRPAAAAFGAESWTDVTGQRAERLPPRPNLVVVELVCAPAVLEALAADAGHGPGSILWEEGNRRAPLDGAAHAFLRARLLAAGMTPAQAREAAGDSPAGRTREETAAALRRWLARPDGGA